jgi:Na+-translocating ferredoxin:NAD+ oxidoreductase RnfC subunit
VVSGSLQKEEGRRMKIPCGSFWNRHKWKLTSKNTRICQKCGRCQYCEEYQPSPFTWKDRTFDEIQLQISKDKEHAVERKRKEANYAEYTKQQHHFDDEDKRRALEFLATLES